MALGGGGLMGLGGLDGLGAMDLSQLLQLVEGGALAQPGETEEEDARFRSADFFSELFPQQGTRGMMFTGGRLFSPGPGAQALAGLLDLAGVLKRGTGAFSR